MKATKNAKKIFRDYLSRKLALNEFKEAMRHPELTRNQKFKISDAYFESIGCIDDTEEMLGKVAINIRKKL